MAAKKSEKIERFIIIRPDSELSIEGREDLDVTLDEWMNEGEEDIEVYKLIKIVKRKPKIYDIEEI